MTAPEPRLLVPGRFSSAAIKSEKESWRCG